MHRINQTSKPSGVIVCLWSWEWCGVTGVACLQRHLTILSFSVCVSCTIFMVLSFMDQVRSTELRTEFDLGFWFVSCHSSIWIYWKKEVQLLLTGTTDVSAGSSATPESARILQGFIWKIDYLLTWDKLFFLWSRLPYLNNLTSELWIRTDHIAKYTVLHIYHFHVNVNSRHLIVSQAIWVDSYCPLRAFQTSVYFNCDSSI